MSGPEEVTLKQGTNQWDLVFKELAKVTAELATVKQLCSDSYGMAQETQSLVRGIIPRVERLEKIAMAREVLTNYAPLAISAINLAGLLYMALHHG